MSGSRSQPLNRPFSLCWSLALATLCTCLGACGAAVSEPGDPLCALYSCGDPLADAGVLEADSGPAGRDAGAAQDAGSGPNADEIEGSDASSPDAADTYESPDFATVCPDGVLNRKLGRINTRAYGLEHYDLPFGRTLRFCAPVQPPLVPVHPETLRFQFYDESDRDCGGASFWVERLSTGERFGTDAPLPGGTVQFRATWGTQYRPELTAPGTYVVAITGRTQSCNRFRFGWDWGP